jgi:hypothetical protein
MQQLVRVVRLSRLGRPGWDGKLASPKHVEVQWLNKLKINSASRWFDYTRKCQRSHKKPKGMNYHTSAAGICYRQSTQDRPTIQHFLTAEYFHYAANNSMCLNCPVFSFTNCICTAVETPPNCSPWLPTPTRHFAPMLYNHHHSPSTFDACKTWNCIMTNVMHKFLI